MPTLPSNGIYKNTGDYEPHYFPDAQESVIPQVQRSASSQIQTASYFKSFFWQGAFPFTAN